MKGHDEYKRAGYLDIAHNSTQPKLSTEQWKGKDFICKMKTFQVLLGCSLILCYLQYNTWAAPSQLDNTDHQETDVDIQETFHDLEALEELIKRQISGAEGEDNIIPTNQSHLIHKREATFIQKLRDALFISYVCRLKILHRNISNFINVSYKMYE